MKKLVLVCFVFLLSVSSGQAQWTATDSIFISNIYKNELLHGQGYNWLRVLCLNIGNRISGSPSLDKANVYMKSILDSLGFDKVWLQKCQVPHWVRGEKEIGKIKYSAIGSFPIEITALGNTNGTTEGGVSGEVLRVTSLDEFEKIPEAEVKGKIVFFDQHFANQFINTFEGYGNTVRARSRGPVSAMQKGAIAALVRSVSTNHDNRPHTGVTFFPDFTKTIPSYAIGVESADQLTEALAKGTVTVYLKSNSQFLGLTDGYNVIGEITGNQFPDEVIVTGGHLDSWDVGQGAHDDGAGCVHAIESIEVLRRLGYKPKRTLRVVLFVNEENGAAGAKKYAEFAKNENKKHILAIESDAGGHAPIGFSWETIKENEKKYAARLHSWNKNWEQYGTTLENGFSGVDVGFLKDLGPCLLELLPESQRYFDYHHSPNDTFDKVNERELHLGTASIASLIYLVDKYGWE